MTKLRSGLDSSDMLESDPPVQKDGEAHRSYKYAEQNRIAVYAKVTVKYMPADRSPAYNAQVF